MSVNRILIRCIILTMILLSPLLLSLMTPDFFTVTNARLNDCFFRLRYNLTGSAPISPYMAVYFLDDPLTTVNDSTNLWNSVFSKLGNNQFYWKANTVILYPGSNVSNNEIRADVSNEKLFLPGMIMNRRITGNPVVLNRIRNVGFIPKVLYKDTHGFPQNVDETFLSFPGTDIERAKEAGSTRGTGITNLFPDADGVIRRLPLFFKSGHGLYYPSLFLAALCHYLDVKLNTIEISLTQVKLPRAFFRMTHRDIIIPVDEKGQMIINYPGPYHASFDLLSAAKLLELDETETGNPSYFSPASLNLAGDISAWSGKFSVSIYDTIYPQVMILASAFNTVFTDNFLKTAGILEHLFLYIPVLIILNIFLIMNTKQTLTFFVIGLTLIIVIIPALIICIQLFLFIVIRCLPGIMPLIIGISGALLLLIIFRLLHLWKQQIPEKNLGVEEEQWKESPEENNTRQQMQSSLKYSSGKATIRDALKKLGITSGSQVEISLSLLNGLEYKEIARNLKISLTAVTQRIRKIYKKCNVLRRPDFFNKVISLIDDINFPYTPD